KASHSIITCAVGGTPSTSSSSSCFTYERIPPSSRVMRVISSAERSRCASAAMRFTSSSVMGESSALIRAQDLAHLRGVERGLLPARQLHTAADFGEHPEVPERRLLDVLDHEAALELRHAVHDPERLLDVIDVLLRV